MVRNRKLFYVWHMRKYVSLLFGCALSLFMPDYLIELLHLGIPAVDNILSRCIDFDIRHNCIGRITAGIGAGEFTFIADCRMNNTYYQ